MTSNMLYMVWKLPTAFSTQEQMHMCQNNILKLKIVLILMEIMICSENFASQLTFRQNSCSAEQIHRVPLYYVVSMAKIVV